jgi:hypothetical protein
MPAPATPESTISRTRLASGENNSNEPNQPHPFRSNGADRERQSHYRKSSDPKAGVSGDQLFRNILVISQNPYL